MVQPSIGLPSIDSISKSAHPAFLRLEAEIRRAEWEILPNSAALEKGLPSIWVEESISCPIPPEGTFPPVSFFELLPGPLGQIRIHHFRCLPMALEELRRQFMEVAHLRGGPGWRAVRFTSRVPLRGVRLPPEAWLSPDLQYPLEFLSSLGHNALLLDALDLPATTSSLFDENHAAEWERPLNTLLDRLHRREWWTMVVLPIQLDLGLPGSAGNELRERPLCRQVPENRRRMLHRFESLVRRLHPASAIGFVVSNWLRCECPLCQRVSFEEEAAYYLRAFNAVLNRYARETELWAIPDLESWGLLQEIRSEIPIETSLMLAERPEIPWQEDATRMGNDPLEREEGVMADLSSGPGGECLDLERMDRLSQAWEEEGPPRLLVAKLGEPWTCPPALAGLFSAAWRIEAADGYAEELVYRLTLPVEEWPRWQAWKERTQSLVNLVARDPGGGPSPIAEELCHMPERLESTYVPLTMRLEESLKQCARRWLAEKQVRPVVERVLSLPETAPPSSGLIEGVLGVLEDLQHLFDHRAITAALDISELRSLEDLRDYLALFLSESSRRKVWRRIDLPDLSVWKHQNRNGA
jgi:hypothetical protein